MSDEQIDWSKALRPTDIIKPKSLLEPKIDIALTKIMGFKVFLNDPRVIKQIMMWKKNKPLNSMEPDNFMNDPSKVAELRKVLQTSL